MHEQLYNTLTITNRVCYGSSIILSVTVWRSVETSDKSFISSDCTTHKDGNRKQETWRLQSFSSLLTREVHTFNHKNRNITVRWIRCLMWGNRKLLLCRVERNITKTFCQFEKQEMCKVSKIIISHLNVVFKRKSGDLCSTHVKLKG